MNFFDDENDPAQENVDTVEADVLIAATVEQVWELISEPGWWINDGDLGDHEVVLAEGGVYEVNDPEAGTWLVEKVDEDPMDVVSYRWYPLAGDELPEEATRVEFSLSEENGRVALHVEEIGLSRVSEDEAVARQAWEDAAGTWEDAFAQAKAYLESK